MRNLFPGTPLARGRLGCLAHSYHFKTLGFFWKRRQLCKFRLFARVPLGLSLILDSLKSPPPLLQALGSHVRMASETR